MSSRDCEGIKTFKEFGQRSRQKAIKINFDMLPVGERILQNVQRDEEEHLASLEKSEEEKNGN